MRETRKHATKNRGPQVIPGLEGVQATGVCVEFATPRGGEEEGEEEVPRRLVTPKGVGGLIMAITGLNGHAHGHGT